MSQNPVFQRGFSHLTGGAQAYQRSRFENLKVAALFNGGALYIKGGIQAHWTFW